MEAGSPSAMTASSGASLPDLRAASMSGFGGVSKAPPRPRVRGIPRAGELSDAALSQSAEEASTARPRRQAELKYRESQPDLSDETTASNPIAGRIARFLRTFHDRGLARHHFNDVLNAH